MKDDGFDYEGVKSENLKELWNIAMRYGLYGPPLDEFAYYAKQAQAEMDGGEREYVGKLDDELRATKRELKIINGQLTVTLNNWEQAKGKLDRERRELDERKRKLDERDAKTAEEMSAEQVGYWKAQAEKARAEAEKYRAACGRMLDLADEMKGVIE